uniref:Uncharacterized protein n=1 Tax=Arundo donax TaxID=35708 RepID=A0A0A9A331_ARUDO
MNSRVLHDNLFHHQTQNPYQQPPNCIFAMSTRGRQVAKKIAVHWLVHTN